MTRPKQVTGGILPPTPPPSQGILTTQSHVASAWSSVDTPTTNQAENLESLNQHVAARLDRNGKARFFFGGGLGQHRFSPARGCHELAQLFSCLRLPYPHLAVMTTGGEEIDRGLVRE